METCMPTHLDRFSLTVTTLLGGQSPKREDYQPVPRIDLLTSASHGDDVYNITPPFDLIERSELLINAGPSFCTTYSSQEFYFPWALFRCAWETDHRRSH